MSKKLLTFLLSVCIIMVLVMAAGKAAPQATPVAVSEDPLAVGVIYVSDVTDGGWSEAHYNGFESLRDMDIQLLYRENVSDRDDSILGAVDDLAQQGAKLIFATSVDYGPYMLQCAESYPDIMFYHCTGEDIDANLATYIGRMYQARYLTGIAAGMKTKTNRIGYVAAFPIPEVLRGINAFTLGVRSVNPQATVLVEWSGAWDDAILEERAVRRLLEVGTDMDILAQHQNTANPVRVLQKLGRTDICAVGYNLDRSADFPTMYLTAAIWDWGAFYRSRLEEYQVGRFVPKHYWEGIETDMVGVTPPTGLLAPGTAERMEAARMKMMTGEWDVFYGPIYDNKGVLRVGKGETLPDNYLLQDLDWLVAGAQTVSEAT